MVTVLGVCVGSLPSRGCPRRAGKNRYEPRSFRGPSVIGYGCNDLEGWGNFDGGMTPDAGIGSNGAER
jgi:hypothetical protein